jgi:hypothetical protein
MTSQPTWRKSSRSQNGPNCVELSNTLTELRDSKNTHGPLLRGNADALVQAIKRGQLNA